MTLDSLDLKILCLLQEDARQTCKQIGLKVHKSISTIYERIKRMEQDGIIRRYAAILDYNRMNRKLSAFTNIQLKDHSREGLYRFESTVSALDEVMECYHTSGHFDFILKVTVSDLQAYHNFLMEKIFSTGLIAHLESTFVMREAKMETALVL
ncbi:winged helix-turn-helix transcriptional regulator [Pedobacter sp. HMF7647]|uniref:Winged helix-turn-helix transcriptional regulator n=1 Tax=Hufsiella arboris TaxID=2695275 RepID=A0A7K1Y6T0_9SPHI|nr:Lrp/AsnC family transcriptional regulator [Hufsiella arboris]MXV50286.1 winged helix-turn-helix transcriptional regulator [Hufsiella arboris]